MDWRGGKFISMLGFEVEGEKKAEFGWRLEAAASGVKL